MNDTSFIELLDTIVDNRGRTAPTATNGVPLIATNCVKDDHLYPVKEKVRFVDAATYDTWFRAHPEPGDILFVCKGSPGRTALVPDPVDFVIAQDMVAVRADPLKIYPKFLFAALRSPGVRQQIDSMHVGSLIPHFKKGDFDRLRIPMPDRETQMAIGDFYSEFSEKIESNHRLAERASAVIDAAASKLLARTETETLPLADLVEFNRVTVKPHSTDALHYIDIASVSPGRIDAVQELTWSEAPSRARRGVNDGDVIYSTVRPSRRSFALILEPRPDSVASTGFAVMTPSTRLGSSMLTSVVGDPDFAEYLESVAHGSAYPAASIQAMGSYPVVIPKDSKIAEQFEVDTMPLRRRVAQARAETERLVALRDTLLPELLSGRVRVPTAGDIA